MDFVHPAFVPVNSPTPDFRQEQKPCLACAHMHGVWVWGGRPLNRDDPEKPPRGTQQSSNEAWPSSPVCAPPPPASAEARLPSGTAGTHQPAWEDDPVAG